MQEQRALAEQQAQHRREVARLQAAVTAEARRTVAAKAEAATAARRHDGEQSAGLDTATREVAVLRAQLAEARATAAHQVMIVFPAQDSHSGFEKHSGHSGWPSASVGSCPALDGTPALEAPSHDSGIAAQLTQVNLDACLKASVYSLQEAELCRLQQRGQDTEKSATAAGGAAAAKLLATSLAGVQRFITDVRATPAPLRASLAARHARRAHTQSQVSRARLNG